MRQNNRDIELNGKKKKKKDSLSCGKSHFYLLSLHIKKHSQTVRQKMLETTDLHVTLLWHLISVKTHACTQQYLRAEKNPCVGTFLLHVHKWCPQAQRCDELVLESLYTRGRLSPSARFHWTLAQCQKLRDAKGCILTLEAGTVAEVSAPLIG